MRRQAPQGMIQIGNFQPWIASYSFFRVYLYGSAVVHKVKDRIDAIVFLVDVRTLSCATGYQDHKCSRRLYVFPRGTWSMVGSVY